MKEWSAIRRRRRAPQGILQRFLSLTTGAFLFLNIIFFGTFGIFPESGNAELRISPPPPTDVRLGQEITFTYVYNDPEANVKGHICILPQSGAWRVYHGPGYPWGSCTPSWVSSTSPDLNEDGDWTFVLRHTVSEADAQKAGCDLSVQGECQFLAAFLICDEQGACQLDTGSLTPYGLGLFNIVKNKPPVASNLTKDVTEDVAAQVTLQGTDPDPDPAVGLRLSYSIASQPQFGTLTQQGTSATYVYTPNANYNGSDSFTYTVNDGVITSTPATVTLNVLPVNDAPRLTTFSHAPTSGIVAGGSVAFTVNWLELEAQNVKVHVCRTNAVSLATPGGSCASGQTLATSASFAASAPYPSLNTTSVTHTVTLADAGADVPYFVFVCDNDATQPLCSPNQANNGTFHVDRTLTLSVTKQGSGSGIVTSAPAGVNCGATCSALYPDGTAVTLTAVADPGSIFDGWGGDCTGVTCALTMDNDKNVTATFSPTFSVTAAVLGQGTIVSTPSGISCSAGGAGDCAEQFRQNEVVSFTPTAAAGYVFTGWQDACTGTGACQVTVNAAKRVVAEFRTTMALTVQKDAAWNGNGTVQVDVVSAPPGGNTTSVTVSTYPRTITQYLSGTQLRLTANPTAPAQFEAWSGDCSGTGTCALTLDASKTAIAAFAAVHTLTVQKTGSGTGTVSGTGIACGADCTEALKERSTVTLSQTAPAGNIFTGWSGGGCSGTGTCSVTMNAATTVTANFETALTLTIQKTGSGTGTATSDSVTPPPGGPSTAVNCSAFPCTYSYISGTQIGLRVTPTGSPVSIFTGWSGGGCSGTSLTCSVTLTSSTTVTVALQGSYLLTVQKNGNGTVRTTVPASPTLNCGATCSQPFADGTSVTLEAQQSDPQYTFTGWASSDPGFSCPFASTCVVTMNRVRTVTANFARSVILTTTRGGSGAGGGLITTVNIVAPPGAPPIQQINCGSTCSQTYLQGTQVTLRGGVTGSPAPVFTGWTSGGCSGTADCTITLNADTTVNGDFRATNNLTVTIVGPGRVSSSPAANPAITNCTTSCTGAYADNVTATLTQTANAGAQFMRWELDCSGSGACSTAMSATRQVRAVFANRPVVTVGAAHAFPVGAAHTHSGALATDADGNIVSYRWDPTTCPGGGCVSTGTITVPATGSLTIPGPTYTPIVAGQYVWTLTVTDATGATGTGTLSEQTQTPPDTQITGCPTVRDGGGSVASCASGAGAQYSTRTTSANFNFTATDPETPAGPFAYNCILTNVSDGVVVQSTSCAGSYSRSGLTVSKEYLFEVRATDPAPSSLQDSTPATFRWRVEPNTPPVVTVTPTRMEWDGTQNIAVFNYVATDSPPDDPLTYRCFPDGTSVNCGSGNSGVAQSPRTMTALGAGAHSFYVRATDNLGVSGDSSTTTFHVPTVSITGGPSGNVIDPDATFSFNGSDGDGDTLYYECRAGVNTSIGTQPWVACGSGGSGSYNYTAPANGNYEFQVRARDRGVAAGFLSPLVTQTWTLANVAVNEQHFGPYSVDAVLGLSTSGIASLADGYDPTYLNAGHTYRCQDRSCATFSSTPAYAPGRNPSLTVGADGRTHISSITSGDLEYAVFGGSNWTTQLIMRSVGTHSSLVLRPDGNPMIFYSKFTNCGANGCSDLRVARYVGSGGVGCLTTAWTCTQLDTPVVNNTYVYGGMSAVYNASDPGPRVVSVLNRNMRMVVCQDANCTSTVATSIHNNWDYDGAAGSVVFLTRTSGTDHLVRSEYNSCSTWSGECRWEYMRRSGTDTGAFSTVASNAALFGGSWSNAYVSPYIGSDGLLQMAYASGGAVGMLNCLNTNCTTVDRYNVSTLSSNVSGLDLDVGSDNIPRMAISRYSGTDRGLQFAICRKPYCAP